MRTYEEFAQDVSWQNRSAADKIGSELMNAVEGPLTGILEQLLCRSVEPAQELYSMRMRKIYECIEQGGLEAPIYNTYPVGIPTDEIFCDFLGICSEEDALLPVLNAADKFCKKAMAKHPSDDKTVLILTDKWDDYAFRRKYAMKFVKLALDHNIVFVFLLVTDYGVVRIPYLPSDRRALRNIDPRFFESERLLLEEQEALAYEYLLKQPPCTYSYDCGTWKQFDGGYYEFDFGAGRYQRTSRDASHPNGIVTEGRIPKKAARKFAAAVYELRELPNDDYSDRTRVLDAGHSSAHVFEKSFSWQMAEDEPVRIVSKAIEELIKALKKR